MSERSPLGVSRPLLGVLGFILLGAGVMIARVVKPEDPLEWIANMLQVVGVLVVLVSFLLNLFRTAWRCMFAFLCSIRMNFAWTRLLAKSESEVQPIVLAFLEHYIEEEVRDIGGKSREGKYFIVTNFVAYSGLVSAIIHAARNICPNDSEVVCFTTLTMPLSKWFNFSEIENAPFRYCRVHPRWEKYTFDLKELINSASVKIQRCVLAVPDQLADQNRANPGFAFKGESEMREHCNYWILVPTQLNSLGPIQNSTINQWLNGPLQVLQTNLKFYRDVDSAYFILPDASQSVSLPSVQGYTWRRLGSVFMELFHSQPQFENARYKVLTKFEWEQYFRLGLPELQRIPEDLFIVGFHRRGNSEASRWVFCLAADIDSTLDKLSLEVISTKLNQQRFDSIITCVSWLNKKSEELQTWVK